MRGRHPRIYERPVRSRLGVQRRVRGVKSSLECRAVGGATVDEENESCLLDSGVAGGHEALDGEGGLFGGEWGWGCAVGPVRG